MRKSLCSWLLTGGTLRRLMLSAAACTAYATGAAAATDAALEAIAGPFAGSWQCSGHFANGKLITSSESFVRALNGHWLIEDHRDNPLFNYSAHALWGWSEELHSFTLTIYDNFGGQRLFVSPGWQQAVLTFEERPLLGPPVRQERFLYRTAPGGYSVEYQVQDKNAGWKMGDVVTCGRHG
jgi:hypothetical protein